MVQGIKARQQQIPSPRGTPTRNQFVVLEPNTDRSAWEKTATPTVNVVRDEEATIAAVQKGEDFLFIIVCSCGPQRHSTKLKLLLESIDSHRPLNAEVLLTPEPLDCSLMNHTLTR